MTAKVDMLNTVTHVDHPFLMDFERTFDAGPYQKWMEKNWTLSLYIGFIYVLLIFGIQRVMENRERFNLQGPLGLWSALLAVFSIMGSVRTVPELLNSVKDYGFVYSYCNPNFYQGTSGFWVMLYTFSKVYELGDTFFIVLRKQRLIFLHWYHHLATLIYMFMTYKDFIALGRWGIVQNFIVHSFMYTYYALRAFKVKVPYFVNVFITSIQLIQMVVGVTLTSYAFVLINSGKPCQVTMENNIYCTFMYISYMILFSNFFYQTYVKKDKSKSA